MRGIGLGRENEDALNARIVELEAEAKRLMEALEPLMVEAANAYAYKRSPKLGRAILQARTFFHPSEEKP